MLQKIPTATRRAFSEGHGKFVKAEQGELGNYEDRAGNIPTQ
jgi:hypothetical protein